MKLEYGGSPADWIARDGLPAKCLGDPLRHGDCGGLPSYESEDGKAVVYEFAVAMPQGWGNFILFPRSYTNLCELAPGGPGPLHHGYEALWKWRPWIYRRSMENDGWNGFGSQGELWWRHAFGKLGEDLDTKPMRDAEARAHELLRENLTPCQLFEAVLHGQFRVIGGATGNAYRIELGNGFAHVDRVNNHVLTNYCLHPEDWMPDADVALAHKLNLEAPDLEEATLEGANARPKAPPELKPRDELYYAADMERELLPA